MQYIESDYITIGMISFVQPSDLLQTIENNERTTQKEIKDDSKDAKSLQSALGNRVVVFVLLLFYVAVLSLQLVMICTKRRREKRLPPPPYKWMQSTECWWASWPWHFIPFHHLAFFFSFVLRLLQRFLLCNRKWSCRLKEEKRKTKKIIAKCYKIFRNKTQRRTFFSL